jgi:hypothetical protein
MAVSERPCNGSIGQLTHTHRYARGYSRVYSRGTQGGTRGGTRGV